MSRIGDVVTLAEAWNSNGVKREHVTGRILGYRAMLVILDTTAGPFVGEGVWGYADALRSRFDHAAPIGPERDPIAHMFERRGTARHPAPSPKRACVDCGTIVRHTVTGAAVMHRTPDGAECAAGAKRAADLRRVAGAAPDLPWPGFTAQCGYECRRGCDH